MNKKTIPVSMAAAMVASNTLIFENTNRYDPRVSDIPFKIPKSWKNGPCEVCGKKNVKRGREEGIYLCEEHFQELESPNQEEPKSE